MIDDTLRLLFAAAHPTQTSLWCLGEGTATFLSTLQNLNKATVCTNRFDLMQQARGRGLPASFSDWQFPEQSFDAIFLRMMKEKPVNQHLLNCAWQNLTTTGRVVLSGRKDEGIKSFAAQLQPGFTPITPLAKTGNAYIIELRKNPSAPPFRNLDYQRMEVIAEVQGKPVFSKPGVYGWQKVDQGSELLVATIRNLRRDLRGQTILDLGCGYGYLTLATAAPGCGRYTATDNNAGALACMAYNAREHGIEVDVVASDCGDTLNASFDIVLCNPPFHAAFNVEGSLTDAFLAAARRHLNPNGAAYFVVNGFIPIERKAAAYFSTISVLDQNRQFKVFELRP